MNRPSAVATSACATPPVTASGLPEPAWPNTENDSIMPMMVPNNPISGASVTEVSTHQMLRSILGMFHMIASSICRSMVCSSSPRQASAVAMMLACSEPS